MLIKYYESWKPWMLSNHGHLANEAPAIFLKLCIMDMHSLRFLDCLAHLNLSATFATDQKWPICHLHISYQSLAGSLCSLKKSEFLKLIISFFHYFWCQNRDQWHKMSGKNTHIRMFYFCYKRVWAEKIRKKIKKIQNLKVAGNHPNI